MDQFNYNTTQIRLPFKSFLLKYLSHFYETNPFRITMHGAWPSHLWLLMKTVDLKYEGNVDQFDDFLLVEIPNEYFKSGRIHYDLVTVRKFNAYMEDIFYWEMNTTVENKMGDMQMKDAINDFLAKYDIDENELAFETAKKRFYRYRKNLKNGKKNTREPQKGTK